MSSSQKPLCPNNPLKRRSGDEMSEKKAAKIEVVKVIDLSLDGDITVNLCLDFLLSSYIFLSGGDVTFKFKQRILHFSTSSTTFNSRDVTFKLKSKY